MMPAANEVGPFACSQKRGSSPSSQTTIRLSKLVGILQTHGLTGVLQLPQNHQDYGVSFINGLLTGDSV